MANLNKATLIGRLGNDPELKQTSSGNSVAQMSLATNEYWTDKSGQKQERTEWHRVVVWGKLAETCAKHLSKGRRVYLEGRIQTRQWESKEGEKRYTTEVVANSVQFLDSNQQAGKTESFEKSPDLNEASEELPF